jgi:tryptophan synthase alpha chain
MNRINNYFKTTRHKPLIAYLTVGYPDTAAVFKAVPILVGNGVDIVELGIPFSDPMADGTTIQKASYNALLNGVTPQLCLELAKKLREKIDKPLIFMTYYNLLLAYGLEKFCRDCVLSGVDGLIIPDLPPDEGTELETLAQKHELALIYLLAPNSTDERIKLVARKSRGFIYLVSVSGVTGARRDLSQDLDAFISKVKKLTKQPVCVGFGISTPEQAAKVAQTADGVIIGSKFIQLMETDNEAMTSLQNFVKKVRQKLDSQ